MRRMVPALVVVTMAAALGAARAADGPPRVWILPFEQTPADSDLEYLEEALPALLTSAFSQSDDYAVVDRQHLNQLLAEQSLTLEGLSSPDTRLRVGSLLGATVMVTGSFVRQGGDLLLTIRATDLERGIVTVTAEASGPLDRLGELVGRSYYQLARDLDRRLPDLAPHQIDQAPLSNLHFMKGLGHYYSARYSHALSEFMLASEEERLSDISRLWLANTYLAERHYEHAYLELSSLIRSGSGDVPEDEVSARMRTCEEHLSPEDVEMIRELAVRRVPIGK